MIQPANTPTLHVTRSAPSVFDLFRTKGTPINMHRPIPAPEPNPEPNPGPDGKLHRNPNNITPADWDALFHAVQARLEHCVDDALHKAPELALHDRHETTKTAVLEYVEAMTQLQAALTLERKQWQAHQQAQLQQAQQHQAH